MGLGSAVHERRVLPRYPDGAIGTKTGTDRYRANLADPVGFAIRDPYMFRTAKGFFRGWCLVGTETPGHQDGEPCA